MNHVFVDTLYFVAIFQANDQWHDSAVEVLKTVIGLNFVTTDSVLIEVLNYFARFDESIRLKASTLVRDTLEEPSFRIIEQTQAVFLRGLELYESRLDKATA